MAAAVEYIKKARLLDQENRSLKSHLVEYYLKLNPDSGYYYYKLFGFNKKGIFYEAFRRLSAYFIDTDNIALSIFICKEELSSPDASVSSCELSPAYALSKNKLEIADTLTKMISQSRDSWVKWRMFTELAREYEWRKEYTKAAEYNLKAIRYDSIYKMLHSGDSCSVENNCDLAISFYMKASRYEAVISAKQYYNIACCYSLTKKENEALLYFEKSIKEGFNNYTHIQKDNDLDFIRNTTKFKALMQQYFPLK